MLKNIHLALKWLTYALLAFAIFLPLYYFGLPLILQFFVERGGSMCLKFNVMCGEYWGIGFFLGELVIIPTLILVAAIKSYTGTKLKKSKGIAIPVPTQLVNIVYIIFILQVLCLIFFGWYNSWLALSWLAVAVFSVMKKNNEESK